MITTITNPENITDDLAPGTYCCRIVSMTWTELRVRFDPSHPHQPGDCLVQLIKQPPAPDLPAGGNKQPGTGDST